MLIHTVFFYSPEGLTDAQKKEFRKGVETLKTIPGIEKAFVGTPAAVPDRPVIDKGYAIGLTVICKDVATHDAYQVHPIHKAFIERCHGYWKKVAVFDYQE